MEINTKILKTVITLAGTQTELVTVRPDVHGWHIGARGADNVTVIELQVLPGAFLDYTPGDPFALRTDELLKALGAMGKTFFMETAGGRAVLTSGGICIALPQYAGELNVPVFPKFTQTVHATADLDLFRRLFAAADLKRSPALKITASAADGLTAAIGDGTGSGVTISCPPEECIALDAPAEAVTASYPPECWQTLVKALPAGTAADLAFAADYPATASFGDANWSGRWAVAPRIGSDDL